MTKKILLSVAASAVLTTSAFAGTIITDRGHAKITEESYLQNGMDVINFSSFEYKATIDNNGALSISDPLVKIDISNLEFPRVGMHAAVAGDNSSELFDEHGRGVSVSELTSNETEELEQHFRSDGDVVYLVDVGIVPLGELVEDQAVINADSSIPFDNIVVSGGKAELIFDGDDSQSLINGHTYVMSMSPTEISPVNIDFKYVRGNQKISLKTFSQGLDNNFQDEAEFTNTTTFPPQFKVNCVRKFDGLINFENDRTTFVNPEHGDRIESDGADVLVANADSVGANVYSDTVIDRDRMIFTIWNARDSSADTRYMGGHGTEYTFDVSNNDNNFTDSTEWGTNLKILTGDKQDTLLSEDLTGSEIEFLDNNTTFKITHPLNIAIPAGLTTYQLDLVNLKSDTPIRPVVFSNPLVDLEGGLGSDGNGAPGKNDNDTEDTNTSTEVNHGGTVVPGDVENNFISNNSQPLHGALPGKGDSTDVIVPKMDGSNTSNDVGEWRDHAYIAQIAGVGHNPSVLSRIFITNRSCQDVTPTFKVIQNGKVQSVTDIGNYKNPAQSIEISVDSQNVYQLKDIIDAAVAADSTGTIKASGVYSIEIILGGIAEDFYVYAQSKNADNTNTYDLPVYNTSARD